MRMEIYVKMFFCLICVYVRIVYYNRVDGVLRMRYARDGVEESWVAVHGLKVWLIGFLNFHDVGRYGFRYRVYHLEAQFVLIL